MSVVLPCPMYDCSMTQVQPRDEAFILSRVGIKESGCWEWLKFIDSATGYGRTSRVGSRTPVGAHVLSYEIFKGEIRAGHVVDHTCSNKICCNPNHLEMVTQQENVRRTVERGRHPNSQKTECPRCNGPYELEVTPARPRGRRWCRNCHNARQNNYARAKRAALREAQDGP